MARKKQKETNQEPGFRRPQLNLHKDTQRGVAVVIFIVLSILATLSLVDVAGPAGQIANRVMRLTFGWMAYGVPLIFLIVSTALLKQNDGEEEANTVSTHAYVGAVFLTLSLTGLLHLLVIRSDYTQAFARVKEGLGGGYLGLFTSYPLIQLLGFVASLVILLAAIVISLLVTFNVSLLSIFKRKAKDNDPDRNKLKPAALKINNGDMGFVKEKVGEMPDAVKDKREKLEPVVNHLGDLKSIGTQAAPKFAPTDKDWKLPSLDLLEESKNKVDSGNIEANVSIIQKTLADFGIDVEMGEVNVGPTVTQYTLRPAVGVKLAQIAGLQNDLALALAAKSLRMELPIPGKALVGLEIPNLSTALVRIREILGHSAFIEHPSKLAFALGRDVAGAPMVTDLSKMPHLLIAGATGSGKSVAVNSLLISLLFRSSPSDVKLILVDPKRVELSLYNGIPHLLTGVVTDHQQAVNSLKWTVGEMDRRYKVLQEYGKRNIAEYNSSSVGSKLPYLVLVIDELADLMSVAQNDVEAAIVRLAQMARAVGIHLVVATQRPSVDVITGLIKANITTRIAFAVASQVDSRTILDMAGAEKLLGAGDMLYTSSELPKPKRIQGTYVNEKEIKKVTDFLKEQSGDVIYDHNIVEKPQRDVTIPGFEGMDDDAGDDLVAEAIDVVRSAGKASASLLQRRLRVGYARAARLLDILEEKGVVGPGEGAKPREVYGVTPDDSDGEYNEEEIG